MALSAKLINDKHVLPPIERNTFRAERIGVFRSVTPTLTSHTNSAGILKFCLSRRPLSKNGSRIDGSKKWYVFSGVLNHAQSLFVHMYLFIYILCVCKGRADHNPRAVFYPFPIQHEIEDQMWSILRPQDDQRQIQSTPSWHQSAPEDPMKFMEKQQRKAIFCYWRLSPR